MKVFVGIMLFFLLFFALGWYTEVMITNQAAAILDQLEMLATYVKTTEMDVIEDQIEIIDHLWVKARNYWVLLIDHHDLDQFEVALARTKAFLDNNAPVFALSEIAALKQIIYRIPDELDLTWENIF
jgi:hypothetical protein